MWSICNRVMHIEVANTTKAYSRLVCPLPAGKVADITVLHDGVCSSKGLLNKYRKIQEHRHTSFMYTRTQTYIFHVYQNTDIHLSCIPAQNKQNKAESLCDLHGIQTTGICNVGFPLLNRFHCRKIFIHLYSTVK